jgi:hypothetical protein
MTQTRPLHSPVKYTPLENRIEYFPNWLPWADSSSYMLAPSASNHTAILLTKTVAGRPSPAAQEQEHGESDMHIHPSVKFTPLVDASSSSAQHYSIGHANIHSHRDHMPQYRCDTLCGHSAKCDTCQPRLTTTSSNITCSASTPDWVSSGH